MVRRFHKKLIKLPNDSVIPQVGIYPKKKKRLIGKDICNPFTAALFTITEIQKQPKCTLVDEWVKM